MSRASILSVSIGEARCIGVYPGYIQIHPDTPGIHHWIHLRYTFETHPGYISDMALKAYGIWHVECIYGSVGYISDISQIHPQIPHEYTPDNPKYTQATLRGLSGCVHGACYAYPGVHMGCIWGLSELSQSFPAPNFRYCF